MIDRYTLPEMGKIWSEETKFSKWLEVELAVCEAWNSLGKIPTDALKKIQKHAGFDLKRIQEIEREVDHDVIAFLTSIAEKVGPDSRYIHLGMTSSDVVDTALSLQLKDAAQIIMRDIEKLLEVIAVRAKQHKNTIMLGRSHGVHAEPITFGLKMALWYTEMQRNLERMKEAKEVIGFGKISGAVGTYAHIDPKVEEIACKKLGIKPDPVSTQIVQRDRHAQFSCALALVSASIEKFATEIRGLQRSECDEVEEPFRKGQKGSSAMPHKKNPITCERLCGMARMVRASAMVALENVVLWHERDISHSSTERVMLPDSTILVDYMLQKMTYIVENLIVNTDKMRRNIDNSLGLIFSQRVLLFIIEKGATREEAYKLVQEAAMKARDSNKQFKDIVMRDMKIRKYLTTKDITNIFNLDYYIRNIGVILERVGL